MAFSTVQDPDGVNHQLCQQDLDNTCACASVAMVVRKMKSMNLDEAAARKKLDKLMSGAHARTDASWSHKGTTDAVVATALSEYKITSAKTWNNLNGTQMTSYLQTRCKKSAPGIAFVDWSTGGGHAIVCLGPDNAGSNVLFLDPGHNAVVSIAVGTLPSYTAPYGNTGTFKSWIVTTV